MRTEHVPRPASIFPSYCVAHRSQTRHETTGIVSGLCQKVCTLSSPSWIDLQVITSSFMTLISPTDVNWGIFLSEDGFDEVADGECSKEGGQACFLQE